MATLREVQDTLVHYDTQAGVSPDIDPAPRLSEGASANMVLGAAIVGSVSLPASLWRVGHFGPALVVVLFSTIASPASAQVVVRVGQDHSLWVLAPTFLYGAPVGSIVSE